MHSRLTQGVRPRVEGKQRTLLSFRVATGTSWSPLCGLKGVKPPVKFGERTWDCSPGHAGKDGPHLAMTEGSCWFSRAASPVWGFTRGTTGSSGSLSCGAREVRSPCGWRGGAHYCSRDTAGPNRPHLGLCPGPNVPLLGRKRSQHCILDSPGESGLVSRGSQGHRSPFESRRAPLGAHFVA